MIPAMTMKADVDALQALLNRYREQTILVGGYQAGKRFDASPDVRRAVEAIRRISRRAERGRRPPKVTEK